MRFSRSEGIVLSFDPTHAIRTVLDEAEGAKHRPRSW